MKDKNKKIKEPFKPEETPNPPQQIDPGVSRKRENPTGESQRPSETPENRTATTESKSEKREQTGNGHLLNDDAEIEDETTI